MQETENTEHSDKRYGESRFSWAIYPGPGQFGLALSPSGWLSVATTADEFTSTEVTLDVGKWHRIRFDWDCEEESCTLSVNGQHSAGGPWLSHAVGICYLLLWSTAARTDEAGLLAASATVGVEP